MASWQAERVTGARGSTAQGGKRPRAITRRADTVGRARAGARYEISEGAPGSGAARTAKRHVRATSGGAATVPVTPLTGGSGGRRVSESSWLAASAEKDGSATWREADLTNPASSVSQLSRVQPPSACSSQQSAALRQPAASSAQCSVAGSQSASSRTAKKGRSLHTRDTTKTVRRPGCQGRVPRP